MRHLRRQQCQGHGSISAKGNFLLRSLSAGVETAAIFERGNEAGISVTAFHHHHHHHLRGKLGCKLCCVVFRGTGYCVATCNAENSTCILTGFIHFLIATILFIDFRNLLSNCRKRGLLATIRCVRCLSTVHMLMFGTKRTKIPAQF